MLTLWRGRSPRPAVSPSRRHRLREKMRQPSFTAGIRICWICCLLRTKHYCSIIRNVFYCMYISQQNLLLSYYILVVCDTVPLNKIMHSTSWIEEGCKYRRFTKQKTCSHWCKKCKQRAWPFLGSRLPAWGRCWGHRTKQQIWETVQCTSCTAS